MKYENKLFNINIDYFNENNILDNSAVGCGVYIIQLIKKDSNETHNLYVGQSLTILKRGGEHLYELFKNPNYLGLTDDNMNDSNLTIKFKVLESCNMENRYIKEKDYINICSPILQKDINDHMLNIEDKLDIIKKILY